MSAPTCPQWHARLSIRRSAGRSWRRSRGFGGGTTSTSWSDRHRSLERLRHRALGAKRSLARREFALGIEALTRFVRREPFWRVHECVFAVLALESEPVDPRL